MRTRRGLFHSDGITTADFPTLQHRGVDPDVSPVVLGCCTQDTRILREIGLRERRHHAAGTGTSDAQADGISDREHLPIQAFSAKSLSPLAVSTTMFGRNRR